MKTTLNVLRLITFLTLVITLFIGLFWIVITATAEPYLSKPVEYLVFAAGMVLFLLIGTFVFGALALFIGKVNPYPNLGMKLLRAVIILSWCAGVWHVYRLYTDYAMRWHDGHVAMYACAAIVLSVMSVKLYRLLNHHRNMWR